MTLDSEAVPWWKKTVVYQIYPRSFMDSNGDGIGDLRGIISKLDYIKDLGVETIWFSPFYSSPQGDMGYDISDYLGIAPEYGDMDICQELIDEIHARDLKVVFDMVMNHTSDQHPWFLESKYSRDNPKRDWYIWRDGKKPHGKAPPNKWRAMITGSGWNYDPQTDQWYWHQFLPFQPDLNYWNPEVKQAMFDIVRFWLQKGVDGFRLDIINAIYEDAQFRENPFKFHLLPSDDDPDNLFRSSIMTQNLPETYQFTKELRSVLQEFGNPERYLVGEVTGPLATVKKYCGENADGLNTVFLFKSLRAPLKGDIFHDLVKNYEQNFPEPYIPTWVFGNHDNLRRITILNDDVQKAKLNTAFQLTARGVPYIYYGEELGMASHHLPVKTSLDAVAAHFGWAPQWILNLVRDKAHFTINRDECRTPMQWNGEINAGFCPEGIKPWLPLTPSYTQRNVEVEQNDPDSLYNCYKRFLKVRKEFPALNAGSLTLLKLSKPPAELLGFTRQALIQELTQKVTVYLNFSNKIQTLPKPESDLNLIISTLANSNAVKEKDIALQPYEGIVFQSQV